ncbi:MULTISPECIES: STAS domain-containing protein [Peptoniphilus]|uniref:Anti-sigma factor antagonist n=1 Tax=Peptoniphilus lacrimalis TaxID=33031 RepID=A0A379C3P2_9FIRM|nr:MULTISPECIES: STAS domain-containing protein [Peptoniphilus]EFK38396.1 STAS domain protein [Peptoniphilus sp. oral taxon 836 str. F0141]MDK7721887.1 STAS domain-containing protein [Peptoniphilus lacrimalis]MDK7731489.1 STAS domain-containing protein [Peptoniphilus lacrimalis]MDK8281312.1 STAS domain-containing protein [Peptoniphilus lacrimalis]SUB56237.1 Anti-anti-sigma-B factor [Peptoniphilus lacrimalis]
MDFKIGSLVKDKKLILIPSGELDVYSTDKFKEEALKAYNDNKFDIELDCSKLEYLDSTGLGALIFLLKTVNDDDNTISISNLNKQILKLFKITKLDEMFEIRS